MTCFQVELGCAVACNQATELGPRLSDWVNIRMECDPTFPAVSKRGPGTEPAQGLGQRPIGRWGFGALTTELGHS